MSDMKTLLDMLRLPRFCGPNFHNAPLLTLQARSEFEPFGRASETWEVEWRLELHMIQSYWMSTTGWRPRKPGLTMEFKGRTEDSVIQQAISFIREMEGQDIGLKQKESVE